RVLDETERRPAFMGVVVLRLPTGDEDRSLGEQGVDVQPLAVVSKTFGPLTLTLNGGYTFVTSHRDLDFWVVTGSFEYEITDAWSLVGEVVSELGTHDGGDVVVLRAGTVLAITNGIDVYTAVGFGLTGDSPDVTVRLGVTIALF
ncbi:MAG: transporter, partial [Candidatus Methylomirabilales bacterium]